MGESISFFKLSQYYHQSDPSDSIENLQNKSPTCQELLIGSNVRILNCGKDRFRPSEGDTVAVRDASSRFFITGAASLFLKSHLKRFGIKNSLKRISSLTHFENYCTWISAARAEAGQGLETRMEQSLANAQTEAKAAGIKIEKGFLQDIRDQLLQLN